MTKVNKEEVYNRLYIAQSKIRDYLADLEEGKYDLDTTEGKDRFEDRMSTILYNLEEADNTVYYSDNGEDVEEEKQTFEEFIDEFMEEFDYEGDMKVVARQSLIDAVNTLKSNGGGYVLSGGLKNGELAKFKLIVKYGTIRIELGDEGFVFEEGLAKQDEDDDYEEHEEEYEDEESYQYDELDQTYEQYEAEEEEPCSCMACQYEYIKKEREEESVYELVEGLSDSITEDAEYIIKAIEEHFGEAQLGLSSNLVEDDYQLLRLYLKLKLNADESEVESLTNRSLMGAWNRHLLLKK